MHLNVPPVNEMLLHTVIIHLTWSELFDAPLAEAGVHRQEVFEPGDLWVRNTTGSTQHGGCLGSLHYLQLGTHVYTGKAEWQQILCKDEEKNKSWEKNKPL